ncbi:hypothetical protein ACI3KW_12130 [Devosia sp. ZW T5_3]|uniref:hypothetical protein n=1 Tax=Devosia sp. ZW T5_3 TaxID=3378085 RepID=UPI003854BFC5
MQIFDGEVLRLAGEVLPSVRPGVGVVGPGHGAAPAAVLMTRFERPFRQLALRNGLTRLARRSIRRRGLPRISRPNQLAVKD